MRMKQQWEMSRFAFVGGTIEFFLIRFFVSLHIILYFSRNVQRTIY